MLENIVDILCVNFKPNRKVAPFQINSYVWWCDDEAKKKEKKNSLWTPLQIMKPQKKNTSSVSMFCTCIFCWVFLQFDQPHSISWNAEPNMHHFNWFQALGIFFWPIYFCYFNRFWSWYLNSYRFKSCEFADKIFNIRTINADVRLSE